MKTHGHLFEEICSFGNLLSAARRAERGKREQDSVGRFRTNIESELLRIQSTLKDGSYKPGGYRETWITHPKRRMISAAPFRDRVVHHAVCNVVMPLFERKMTDDLYSNRAGKGTHAAIVRAQEYARRYPHVLKCDISKFFPSMDHEVLKAQFRRTIACAPTLALLDRIVDGSNPQEPVCSLFPGDDLAEAATRRVGLPIGNLTSQWFGCIYLSAFDHWVKETLRCGGYVRYVDDFLLFGETKAQLGAWRTAIQQQLASARLRLNERKSRSYPSTGGITFLGQRIWPGRRRLAPENVRAARRRLRWSARLCRDGRLTKDMMQRRWDSWRGHAQQAQAGAAIASIRVELMTILGGSGTSGSCAAGRGVEQHIRQSAVRQSQQQHTGERQQQLWLPVCQGDSECAAHRRVDIRAERSGSRTAAASRQKAHRSRPVSPRPWRGNEDRTEPGAGSLFAGANVPGSLSNEAKDAGASRT